MEAEPSQNPHVEKPIYQGKSLGELATSLHVCEVSLGSRKRLVGGGECVQNCMQRIHPDIRGCLGKKWVGAARIGAAH